MLTLCLRTQHTLSLLNIAFQIWPTFREFVHSALRIHTNVGGGSVPKALFWLLAALWHRSNRLWAPLITWNRRNFNHTDWVPLSTSAQEPEVLNHAIGIRWINTQWSRDGATAQQVCESAFERFIIQVQFYSASFVSNWWILLLNQNDLSFRVRNINGNAALFYLFRPWKEFLVAAKLDWYHS